MKFLPLLWSGLWRKRARTIFTLLSIVTAFLLFGMLQGVLSAFDKSLEAAAVDRLTVVSKVSFTEPLPYSYLSQIETMPGVAGVDLRELVRRVLPGSQEHGLLLPDRSGCATSRCPGGERLAAGAVKAMMRTRTGAAHRLGAREEVRLEGRRPRAAALGDLDQDRAAARTGTSTSSASSTARPAASSTASSSNHSYLR